MTAAANAASVATTSDATAGGATAAAGSSALALTTADDDNTAFMRALPSSLRQAILFDMDHSQISALPALQQQHRGGAHSRDTYRLRRGIRRFNYAEIIFGSSLGDVGAGGPGGQLSIEKLSRGGRQLL